MSTTSSSYSHPAFHFSESSASSYESIEDHKFDEYINYDEIELESEPLLPVLEYCPISDLNECLSALLFRSPSGAPLSTIYRAIQTWMTDQSVLLPDFNFVVMDIELEKITFKANFTQQPTCLALLIGTNDMPLGVAIMSHCSSKFSSDSIVSYYLTKTRTAEITRHAYADASLGVKFRQTTQHVDRESLIHDEESFGMWLQANLSFFFQI